MSELEIRQGASPFDALKRTDEHGEYWSAREVAGPLGYTWRRFADAIERGRIALQANGQNPDEHIRSWTAPSKINGRGNGGPGLDYHMTREGVYATIQGGDPRKPEIAAAWAYFRAKTREAEVAQPAAVQQIPSHPEALRGWAEALERAAGAERQIAIDAPKVAFVETYVEQGDASTFKVVAGQLGVTEPELRQYLIARAVVYRRTVDQRWSTSKRRTEPVYQWLARSQYATWFAPKDQLNAPRMHNGQYRTTLYITPVGKVGIEAMMRRRPILGQAELDVAS